MSGTNRWRLAAWMLLAGQGVAQAQTEWHSEGFLALRAGVTDAPVGWLQGGYGRLLDGADDGLQAGAGLEGRWLLGFDSGLAWSGRLHLAGRTDRDAGGRHLGVVEAFIERRWFGEDGQRWQLRGGQFFLPTSMENIERGWVSPYTLTHSALNSWIGEEFRPLGLDLSWRRALDEQRSLELAATVFQGNDASGALLAWRGFAWHDRVSVYGEALPLPDLFSLRDPAIFGDQRDDGTQPFGRDLDGRPGYALRLRLAGERQAWRLAAVDSRGDLELHRGEYAWRSRFVVAGWERDALSEGWGYAAEWLAGDTRMGIPGRPKVHLRFNTAYLLASYGRDPWRCTVRVEGFDSDDLDRSAAENNEESGWALTLAALRQFERWRVGVEYLYVDGHRPAAAVEGQPLQQGGQQLRLEVRYLF
ncbi:MAG: hypothetical protein KDI51_03560 [Xanthomonadales bacterium]|nr:hypothetical protein [Xanthomonadales bacterium]